jgi:hypothetical protein
MRPRHQYKTILKKCCMKIRHFRFLPWDFVCLYNYEFWLSLCKIVRGAVILLLPLLVDCLFLDIWVVIYSIVCFLISESSYIRLSISWYLGRRLDDCLFLDIWVDIYLIVYFLISGWPLSRLSITLSRNESGRFGALKSDTTHNFFRNACIKLGSLRFLHLFGCCLIYSVYLIMCFDFPFVRLFGVP